MMGISVMSFNNTALFNSFICRVWKLKTMMSGGGHLGFLKKSSCSQGFRSLLRIRSSDWGQAETFSPACLSGLEGLLFLSECLFFNACDRPFCCLQGRMLYTVYVVKCDIKQMWKSAFSHLSHFSFHFCPVVAGHSIKFLFFTSETYFRLLGRFVSRNRQSLL